RPESDPDLGAEVAEDLPLGELLVDTLEPGHPDRHAGAAPRLVALRGDLESGPVRELDQVVGQVEAPAADRLDADLLDHVVAALRAVEPGHVGRAGQEARNALRVLELRLERERARVALPADE